MPFDPTEDDKEIDVLDQLMERELTPAAMGPGGNLFTPFAFDAMEMPEFTAENVICLRGPCRHYWETKQYFEAGNTAGTLDHAPMYTQKICLKQPGVIVNMNDEVVKECNAWEPLDNLATTQRDKAREEFYQRNPQFRPQEKK
jgi:hypothetical protein